MKRKAKPKPKPKKGKPAETGRPPIVVDLAAVREQARLGQWKPTLIARVIGVPRQTLLGPKHKDEVLEAIEDGRALFEKEAYEQYDRAINEGAHPSIISALIFKMKQIGWSDKIQTNGSGLGPITLDLEGATERFVALVERFMKTQAAQGEEGRLS